MPSWTVQAILSIARLSDPQLRPDGSEFVWVQKGEIYISPVAAVKPRVLQKGARPRWSPDAKTLAYVANGQVCLYNFQTNKVRILTNSPTPISTFHWSPDGKSIGYLALDNAKPADPEVSGEYPRWSRLFLQPLDGGPARQLTTGQHHVVSFALSNAFAVYAAQKTPLNQDTLQTDLYRVDLANQSVKSLVEQPGRDVDPSISPDGKLVAFHSQCGSMNYFEQRDVALIASNGAGGIRYITRDKPFDVFRGGNAFTWSPDSSKLTYTAGTGVYDRVIRHDLSSNKAETVIEGIAGAPSLSANGGRLLYLRPARNHPPEITLFENGEPKRLTNAFAEIETQYPAFESRPVKWTSKDGESMEGMLWLPVGYTPQKPVPLLVELHGGPTGVTLDAFPTPSVYPVQALLQNGIAVFNPNFRGSVNYGARIRKKNALSQGEGDFEDVMSGVDYLIAQGIANPDRLGIAGWSYGGYLTIATITKTNRFKAASIGAPATDWITYYGQSDGPKEVLWSYFGGTPWEVPENYNRHSPRSRLKDVRTPSLLQVGALDINHNGEIHRALVDNHVEVVHTVYPREGHGFAEPAHIRDTMERNLAWFLRWLAQ